MLYCLHSFSLLSHYHPNPVLLAYHILSSVRPFSFSGAFMLFVALIIWLRPDNLLAMLLKYPVSANLEYTPFINFRKINLLGLVKVVLKPDSLNLRIELDSNIEKILV